MAKNGTIRGEEMDSKLRLNRLPNLSLFITVNGWYKQARLSRSPLNSRLRSASPHKQGRVAAMESNERIASQGLFYLPCQALS